MNQSSPGVPNPSSLPVVSSASSTPIWDAGLNNVNTANLVIVPKIVTPFKSSTPIVLPGQVGLLST